MTFIFGTVTALWLGILTSMSPCPLATNIVAISYVSRRAAHSKIVLISGLLYTMGRMVTYAGIGIALVSGLLAIPGIAFGLQKYMNVILGPVLFATGVVILRVVPMPSFGSGLMVKFQNHAEQWGAAGAFFIGLLFALSFCPVSAGLFFGSLIPLSITQNSRFMYPALYGFGTALPVLLVSAILAYSAQSMGRIFNKISQVEIWARRITGAVFLLVGVYYTVFHTLKLGQ